DGLISSLYGPEFSPTGDWKLCQESGVEEILRRVFAPNPPMHPIHRCTQSTEGTQSTECTQFTECTERCPISLR
ncbi:hypothetical protein L211DRAFT_789868, partial [Terfezia boudieri ATCC MYA-4762]